MIIGYYSTWELALDAAIAQEQINITDYNLQTVYIVEVTENTSWKRQPAGSSWINGFPYYKVYTDTQPPYETFLIDHEGGRSSLIQLPSTTFDKIKIGIPNDWISASRKKRGK